MDDERKVELVKEFYDLDISHDVNDFDNVDCTVYNESSADGYDLFVITNNTKHVSICEDVYYYDSQWFEKLADYLRDGCTVYIDSYTQDEYGFEEVIEALYEELYMEIYDDMEEVLTGEGYEYEKE